MSEGPAMYELSIKSDFAASHYLPDYKGKCRKLHGHTWKVEAVFTGECLNKVGMVVDFAVIKRQFKTFLENLDHVHLNNLPYFKKVNPTTEHLAKYIFNEFSRKCRPLIIKRVTVWESDTSSITYYE